MNPLAAFIPSWTTGLRWGVATVDYQAATWAQHPGSSFGWIAAVGACLLLALWALRRYGAREADGRLPLPQQA